jgi:GH43 family beta-xylosidase
MMKKPTLKLTIRSQPRSLFSLALLLVLGVVLMLQPNSTLHGQNLSEEGSAVVNPLIPQRADPWVYLHTDGYYYFTASVPEYDRIEVRRATTIEGLASASPVVAWEKHASGVMSKHIWAPEIHYIDDKWYIYFAAARVDAFFDHRIYVLENESANPLEGTWVEKGQLRTNWESFSLDATSFEHDGVRYLVWAQRANSIPGNSNLYIAPLSNPWTISGEQVLLTKPEFDWEIQGFLVNEGAAILKRNGRIFITYSASATDANYAMGLLTASDTSDVLDPASWSKSPEPIFTTNRVTGQFGPGHNSFTVSPEGDDLLVYHARNYENIVGDPLYDPNRHTRVQKLYWNADGTPHFGIPIPDGPLPWRFKAYGTEADFVRHNDDSVIVDSAMSNVATSQFRLVAGLAHPASISFEAVDAPGSFLSHRNGDIILGVNDGSQTFAADATWKPQPGLADESAVSFESYSLPGQYMLSREGKLVLSTVSTDTQESATFIQER